MECSFPRHRRPRGALMLLETVIAIGLIGLGIGTFFLLFQQNIRRTSQARSREIAAFLAQRTHSEVKAWSARHHQSNSFSDWGPYNDATLSTEITGFRVSTKIQDHLLHSPCSKFENLYPGTERRILSKTVKELVVSVDWGSDNNLTCSSLIALPQLAWGSTDMQIGIAGSSTIPPDAQVELTAVYDATTRAEEFSDLTHFWRIKGNGNGTLMIPHHSRSASLSNYVLLPPDDRKYYTGSQCRVELTARYAGQTHTAESGRLNMEP